MMFLVRANLGALVGTAFACGVPLLANRVDGGRFPSYSILLFVVCPFLGGFLASMVAGFRCELGRYDFWSIGLLTCIWSGSLLIGLAIEGLGCLAMAAPLLLVFVFFGSFCGAHISNDLSSKSGKAMCFAAILPLIAATRFLETALPQETTRTTETSIVIATTPAKIWPHLSSLRLGPPEELMFRGGVAHPIEIKTDSVSVGAERQCVLSTGAMEEVLEVVDPDRRLKFRVLSTPPTMKELNPFGEVHAAHLTGFYECVTGEFRLEPIDSRHTRLVGTSVYLHRYQPALYWNVWCDAIVHQVHHRVMDEIRRQSESF